MYEIYPWLISLKIIYWIYKIDSLILVNFFSCLRVRNRTFDHLFRVQISCNLNQFIVGSYSSLYNYNLKITINFGFSLDIDVKLAHDINKSFSIPPFLRRDVPSRIGIIVIVNFNILSAH